MISLRFSQVDLGDQIGAQQVGQGRGIDLVRLDARVCDRFDLGRVGDDHSGSRKAQNRRDLPGVERRLQNHGIGCGQRSGELLKSLSGAIDAEALLSSAFRVHGSDLNETLVDVESVDHACPPGVLGNMSARHPAEIGEVRQLSIRALGATGWVVGRPDSVSGSKLITRAAVPAALALPGRSPQNPTVPLPASGAREQITCSRSTPATRPGSYAVASEATRIQPASRRATRAVQHLASSCRPAAEAGTIWALQYRGDRAEAKGDEVVHCSR